MVGGFASRIIELGSNPALLKKFSSLPEVEGENRIIVILICLALPDCGELKMESKVSPLLLSFFFLNHNHDLFCLQLLHPVVFCWIQWSFYISQMIFFIQNNLIGLLEL